MKKQFQKGEVVFDIGDDQGVWQVEQGFIALEVGEGGFDRPPTLTQLALPGDVLGVECLCGQGHLFRAVALMPTQLRRLQPEGTLAEFTLISQGYLQQQRRLHDMARLRTGPVKARLAHLLQLLSPPGPTAAPAVARHQLPTMKEMALILDVAHETVCRELNHFLPTRKKDKHQPAVSGLNSMAVA